MKYFVGLLLLISVATVAKVTVGPNGSGSGTATPPNGSSTSNNCSITTSIAASALTIALKDAAGADPSSSSPCIINFRSATATSGVHTQVSVQAATSVVISNGSSLGSVATSTITPYVYAINNAGTVVLGVENGSPRDEGSVASSTAEGGAGTADSGGVIYTTSAQTSKALRLLGRVTIAPAASFAWTNAATEVSNFPLNHAITTSWASCTMTLSGWVSNATITSLCRRVGDSLEIKVKVACTGAPTSATLIVNLPAGLVINTAKLIGTTSGGSVLPGAGQVQDAGVANYPIKLVYRDTTSVLLAPWEANTAYVTANLNITQAVPITFGNTDTVEFDGLGIPIVGW
jgi:hypothetical protein